MDYADHHKNDEDEVHHRMLDRSDCSWLEDCLERRYDEDCIIFDIDQLYGFLGHKSDMVPLVDDCHCCCSWGDKNCLLEE